ncbi:helix-turn-helix domain-containing protein [Halopiger aswanensis]|uniref:Helix-turn-helix protein n=1 Tax=Halopiger aswanensis TaxID=148449 RepID=A0A419WJN6_9EURY|nr:helix-turn-helix domain-containing protein [Halopiger aswanensis]RKD95647.1 helix-turn-helix protein [Halopiger aswanensis]
MVDESDKLNRFEEAFQRGQKGQVSNYETWLQDKGIDPNKSSIEYLTKYFYENPEKTVNHEEQLESTAEYLGFFSQRSNIYHLPIIGVSGIGKTQFLHTVQHLLKQTEPEITQKYLKADRFTDIEDEEEQIFEIRDELRDLEKVVIFIDNCEWKRIESLTEALRVIDTVVDDALFLTSWTPEYWNHHREDVEDVVPASKEIHLTSFQEDETVDALEQIFRVVADDGLELPEALLQKIHGYSSGIPRLFTLLALETLRETFLKETEIGDAEAVDAAAEKMNLVGLEEEVYDLSETKLTILTHMVLWHDKSGIRPSQLVDLIDRDKSTVSYHLKDLRSAGLVESEKQGRSAYYQIKEPVKPFIQTRINQTSEYHGEL